MWAADGQEVRDAGAGIRCGGNSRGRRCGLSPATITMASDTALEVLVVMSVPGVRQYLKIRKM